MLNLNVIKFDSDYMKYLETALQKEIALIIGALLLTAGVYTVGTQHQSTTSESKPVTEVQLRAYDVAVMMNTISSDSSQQDLTGAYDRLRLQAIWLNRQVQTPEIKNYATYLDACSGVIYSYLHHIQPDLAAMNAAKAALF
jgi:hypothetical protein